MPDSTSLAPLRSVTDVVYGIAMHGRVSVADAAHSDTPIVFVHGLGGSTRYMEPTMALVAAHHNVAGPDLPGFGRSGTPSRVLTLRELSTALQIWLDARGIGPAVFVGNSHGCQVIVELASQAPHRVAGLVLNAPTMDPAHRTMLGTILRAVFVIPREPVALAAIIARDYLRAGPFRLLGTLHDALRDPIERKLASLQMPVLVVAGRRDPLVTVAWAERVARLVGSSVPSAAGAEFTVIETVAHALPFDDPSAFAPLILAFTNRIDAPQR